MRKRIDQLAPVVTCPSHPVGTVMCVILLLGQSILFGDAPCTITNEAGTFLIHSSAESVKGHMTLVWESCSDHLYEVQTAQELSPSAIWTPQDVVIGSNAMTSWTDPNSLMFGQRFYRVQRLNFDADEDYDGVSNIDEFNRGTDLHNPELLPDNWQPQFTLPASMIVGQTSTLSVLGAPANCACQWTIVSGKAFFTNTVNCTTDFRPSYSGAVTVQVVCASAGVSHTNRARTVVAFPKLSPILGWNELEVQYANNCYNFSTDLKTGTFAQPGRAAGVPAVFPPHDCRPDTAGAVADGLRAGVNIDDLCHTSGLPEGHIIALLVAPDYDYHFIRLEADGTWSSKSGGYPATTLDNNGRPMTDARTADLSPYRFCEFLWVGPNVHVQ